MPPFFNRFRLFLASPLGLFFSFSLWSLVLTYPLGLHLLTHLPLGDEHVGTVPFFNLWTLQWNIDQLMAGFPNYWDAPIFAPLTGTFAFSEIQTVSALLAAPLWLYSPALGYNSLILLFLTLNGWFAFWLLREWGLARLPALLAGLLCQSMPFVAQEMGVLQLVAVFGFLWALLFLSRFLRRPRPNETSSHKWAPGGSALGLALALPLLFFTCAYYGLFSLVFLPLAFVSQFQRGQFGLKKLGQLLAVGLLALALTVPLVWTQQQHLAGYGFNRSTQLIEINSASLVDYGKFLDYNLWYGRLLGLKVNPGQRLFPGLGLILLAVLGLWGTQPARLKAHLVLAVLLALLLSLGLHFVAGGLTPYAWLKDHLPGFNQLRSPFRFAVMVQVHLVLLAGLGLGELLRRKYILIPVAALAIFELLALPLPLQTVPNLAEKASWETWLRRQSPPPTIILLPVAPGPAAADFEQTTLWMLRQRYFQSNLVNGYSGFSPPDHPALREIMNRFPTETGLTLLRDKGVDFVVIHHRLAGTPSPVTVQSYLAPVYYDTQNDVGIYAFPPTGQ